MWKCPHIATTPVLANSGCLENRGTTGFGKL